jgi:hypothetical protein
MTAKSLANANQTTMKIVAASRWGKADRNPLAQSVASSKKSQKFKVVTEGSGIGPHVLDL